MNTHISTVLRFINRVFFSVALALLVSCSGGGGDSGSGGGGDGGATTISGTALAPNGTVAQFRNQTFMYALSEFLLPSVGATITGLDPVPGALVELIEVDDSGDQVGPVLASSATSITGHYNLVLPAGVNLAANLVVRITGTNVDLRAMVVQTAVDITPLSEFILRKFIDSSTPLSTLTVGEVVSISGHAAEFDLAATSDLSSMLTALEADLGPFIDQSIIAVTGTPGAASAIAGAYHFNSYSMYLQHINDPALSNVVGHHDIGSGGATLTLTDDGGNGFSMVTGPDYGMDANLSTWNNANYWVGYDVDIGQGGDTMPHIGTVNSHGDFNLTFPFSEDIWDDTYGARNPPGSENLYNSGVDGVRFFTFSNRAAIYHTIDTNNDGIDDAVDPNDLVGHEGGLDLGALAPQASGMTIDDMAADYGTVRLVNWFTDSGLSGVETRISASTLFISGELTDTSQTSVTIERTPTLDGATFAQTVDTTPSGGELTVSTNGQLTYTDPNSTTLSGFGFASSNGEFAVLSVGDGVPSQNSFTLAISGQILIVKTPTGTPDLSGRTYRLMGIEKILEDNGRITIQRLRGDDDRLVFNGDGSQVAFIYNGVDTLSRSADSEDFTAVTQNVNGSIDHPVTISAGGAIGFIDGAPGPGGHEREWRGYISASSNIIILNAFESANDGNRYAQGMYVAVPVN